MRSNAKKISTLFLIIIVVMAVVFISQYKTFLSYMYPLKYMNFVVNYSKEYELDPYLVSALINVESHYDKDAQSNKDAKGLMQVTPSTGKWVAEKLGIKSFNESLLFDPKTNVQIGCWYLNSIKKEFGLKETETDLVLMLASYNGGSGNVKKWLKNKTYSQTGATLDQIPFKETQLYVKKVLWNIRIYKWLYPDIESAA